MKRPFCSFNEIEQYILQKGLRKTVVLAGSHSRDTLSAVVSARRRGVVSAVLVGEEQKTRDLLSELDEDPQHYRILHQPDSREAAVAACRMVAEGEADIPMKGSMETRHFMHAVLDKRFGFIPENGLLCQATVLEFAAEKRLLIISDCAVNITPDYNAKLKITAAAVRLAHQLGIGQPKVAVIAPVEVVNPAMPSAVDAAMLSKACERGQIPGCIVDGPLALDNAVNVQAARAKGVGGEVAGNADILIMPDLCTGNVFTKSLHYFAHLNQSGSITGSSVPIVMTSRTDTPEDKYFSVLVAVMQSP